MKHLAAVFGVYTLFAASHLFAEPTIGLRPCGVQKITWDFSSDPASNYMIEVWSLDQGSWEQVTRFTDAVGRYVGGKTSEERIEQGKLYRVRGCDDEEAGVCVDSPVIWSPLLVCSEDRTPDNLSILDEVTEYIHGELGELTSAGISHEMPIPYQIVQSNVNHVLAELDSLGRKRAPRMSKPSFVQMGTETWLDNLIISVYMVYEQVRTGQPADLDGTGYEDMPQPGF